LLSVLQQFTHKFSRRERPTPLVFSPVVYSRPYVVYPTDMSPPTDAETAQMRNYMVEYSRQQMENAILGGKSLF